MESAFIDDYADKMKQFKQTDLDDYEGEYTFTVCVGVIDDTIEIKDTVTMGRLIHLETESRKSDEDYNPDSNVEISADIDERRRQLNN